MKIAKVGVDLGATFTKICIIHENGKIDHYMMRSTAENTQGFFSGTSSEKKLSDFLQDETMKWKIAGCGSKKFNSFFLKCQPTPIFGDEMVENAIGVKMCLSKYPEKLHFLQNSSNKTIPSQYIIASLGTGINYNLIDDEHPHGKLINGSSFGGGTLLALSKLLLGTNDFSSIIELASKGDSSKLDLSILDLCGEDYGSTLRSDIVASSLAKAAWMEESPKKEDLASSLIKMVSFAIGCQMAAVCKSCNSTLIILIGGILDTAQMIANNINDSLHLYAPEVTVLTIEDSQYIGAFGAAISIQ